MRAIPGCHIIIHNKLQVTTVGLRNAGRHIVIGKGGARDVTSHRSTCARMIALKTCASIRSCPRKGAAGVGQLHRGTSQSQEVDEITVRSGCAIARNGIARHLEIGQRTACICDLEFKFPVINDPGIGDAGWV